MSLTLSNLKPAKGATKRKQKVGRGGKRGTYSGRGMKGQKSRSGGRSGLKAMGFKQTLQRIPKNRGFKSLKPKMAIINIDDINKSFTDGEEVTRAKMKRKQLINEIKNGVKVLGDGKLDKKLIIEADAFSISAKKAIIEAGGEVIIRGENKKIAVSGKK